MTPSAEVNFRVEKKECDCKNSSYVPEDFVGKWTLDKDSFQNFLQKSVGDDTSIDRISGDIFLTIDHLKNFKYELIQTEVIAHKDDILMQIKADGIATKAHIEAFNTSKFCLKNITSDANIKITLQFPGQPPAESESQIDFSFDEGVTFESLLFDKVLKVKRELSNGEVVDFIFYKI